MKMATVHHGRIPNPAMIVNPDQSVVMRRRSQIGWVKRYAQQGDMKSANRIAHQLGATVQDVLSGRVTNEGEAPRNPGVAVVFPARLEAGGIASAAGNVTLFAAGWMLNGLLTHAVGAKRRVALYNYYGRATKDAQGKYGKSTRPHIERVAAIRSAASFVSSLVQTVLWTHVPFWIDSTTAAGFDRGDGGNSVVRGMMRVRNPILAGAWMQTAHALADRWLSRNPADTFQALIRSAASLGPTYKATKNAAGVLEMIKEDGRYVPDWDSEVMGYLGKGVRLDAMGNAELEASPQNPPAPPAPPAPPKVGSLFGDSREVWDPTVMIPPPVHIPVSVGCGNDMMHTLQAPQQPSLQSQAPQPQRRMVTI